MVKLGKAEPVWHIKRALSLNLLQIRTREVSTFALYMFSKKYYNNVFMRHITNISLKSCVKNR